jgi:hypothetical protein
MDNKKNRLFIHKNMEPVTLEQSIEIVLTPQFYTFIREELDIKFAYQAKQIAASLFDDYLEDTEAYQFYVNKCEGYWCFFAYDVNEIETFLESVGINKERISKIYFAQELHQELEAPIQLSEKSVLKTVDDIVTVIPMRLIDNDVQFKPLDLSNVKLTSGISMGASLNSLISFKQSLVLSSLFFILGVLFLVEGNRIKSSLDVDNAQLTQLLNDNVKYSSSMIRASILEQYQPIENMEHAKRQALKEISKFLSANSHLTNLKIEKSIIKASIKTSNANFSKQIQQSAKAKKFKSTSSGLLINLEKKL